MPSGLLNTDGYKVNKPREHIHNNNSKDGELVMKDVTVQFQASDVV